MEHSALFVCGYKDVKVAVRVEDSMDFKQVLQKVGDKLKDHISSISSVSLRYSIRGFIKCKLESTSDLENLFVLLSEGTCRVVHVIVCDRILDPDENMQPDSTPVVSSGSCSDSDIDDDDLLPTFYAQPEKVLLSASWKDALRKEGQKFDGGVKEFRSALVKYSAERGVSFRYVRNEKTRVVAECKTKDVTGCKWYIRGREVLGCGVFYIVKFVSVHTCGVVVRTKASSGIGSRIVSDIVLPIVGEKPMTRPVDVVKTLKKDYGVDISYRVAWVGVEKARGALFGDNATQFDELRWYVDTARKTNPNSVIELDVDHNNGRFRRLFVSFYGCISGFQFCRPMLFLDGTFLKGRYKGVLLAATAKDGNQGLFPVAFAIVDAENDENWLWFLQQLKNCIGMSRNLTFVSDRQKGLLEAVPEVFPNSHHGFCLNHLRANVRDKLAGVPAPFKENIVKLFRKCAYAPTPTFFQRCMQTLRRLTGNRLRDMLDDLPPQNWANAYFRGRRYGEMTSNAAESFNNWIIEARHLPITGLVDKIRLMLTAQLSERRLESEKWGGKICPVMEEKLLKMLEDGRTWDVVSANDNVIEIRAAIDSFFVHIVRRLCSCHEWQLNGFPCVHAVVALHYTGRDVCDYIEQYFRVDCFKEAYKESVLPVPSSERRQFDCTLGETIKAPITKKQPGRDKKRRLPSRGERTRQIKCGRCKKLGNHNRKTCKVKIAE